MAERVIQGNGIEIWTESFGDPTHEPLLLVMGASAQGIYWHESLVAKFVARKRFVIRYDNRDTGQSTCFDFAENPYTLADLADDAVAVLDAYDIDSAHVAGASMGGMIVQQLAIHNRDRLRTATIIMSSPLSGGSGSEPDLAAEDLPGPEPAWMEQVMALQFAPSESREDRIEQRIKMFELLGGSLGAFDPARQRDIATREVDRAVNFTAMNNHGLAIAASSPADRRQLLAALDIPTLVVHGTEDPILPYPHGVALAQAIPNATLFTMDKAGHEMPDVYLDEMIDRMIALAR